MGTMLDVAVGLTFVYLTLSLVCTAMAEATEHVLRNRSHYLKRGIESLLLGRSQQLRTMLYQHPLIKSLYEGPAESGWIRGAGPSYIPSRQFALALLDLTAGAGTHPGATSPQNVGEFRAALSANVNNLPADVINALSALLADAGDDFTRLKTNIQEWFDGSMDRVAGWYKRRTQLALLVFGVTVAVGTNADTLEIVHTLANNSAVRAAVVAAAANYAPSPEVGAGGAAGAQEGADSSQGGSAASATPSKPTTPSDVRERTQAVVNQIGGLGIPIGWRWYDDKARSMASEDFRVDQRVWPGMPGSGRWTEQLKRHVLGWLLTSLALSLGAPFWFDLLNKIMVIRSTVKPREKSRDEGSEDRQMASPQPIRIELAGGGPKS